MQNLIPRSHVDNLIIEADAWEEYRSFCESPEKLAERIEDEILEEIELQTALAERNNETLSQYRERLADRRDSLMLDLQFARNMR